MDNSGKSAIVKSEERCYVAVESSKDFELSILSIISISLVSKFVGEVQHEPPDGIPNDSCKYHISVTKKKDTTVVTVKGEGLNSSGDSKLSGLGGFQQSILKSLFRSLKNKRSLICQDYKNLLEECRELKIKKLKSDVLLGISESKKNNLLT